MKPDIKYAAKNLLDTIENDGDIEEVGGEPLVAAMDMVRDALVTGPEDTRTMQDLAKEALDIQDACNLSGLVLAMARAMRRFNELNPGIGTEERNKHPIWFMWSDKIASLTGSQLQDSMHYIAQMQACEQLAQPPKE